MKNCSYTSSTMSIVAKLQQYC